MKCPFRAILFTLLIAAAIIFCGASICGATPVFQNAKHAAPAQADEQESLQGYEEDGNGCEYAAKEADILKRGRILIECIKNYPTLMLHLEKAYQSLLSNSHNDKKYQELEMLAEQWLKLHPNDLAAMTYDVEAAANLHHDEKYVQRATELYRMKPISDLAIGIAKAYERMNKIEKCLEWTEIAIKFPENEANFSLSFYLVQKYWESKDSAKTMEWAQATLKAADLVKHPRDETRKELFEKRHACYDIIGKNLYKQGQYPEAIRAFKQALKIKAYAEGYYYIGVCLQNQKKWDTLDNAMFWYAKTDLWCEKNVGESKECKEFATKAKENLEKLCGRMRDCTSMAVSKAYKWAKSKPDSFWISDEN
jgi:tetratricopeptide (TPR) repeat protein